MDVNKVNKINMLVLTSKYYEHIQDSMINKQWVINNSSTSAKKKLRTKLDKINLPALAIFYSSDKKSYTALCLITRRIDDSEIIQNWSNDNEGDFGYGVEIKFITDASKLIHKDKMKKITHNEYILKVGDMFTFQPQELEENEFNTIVANLL